jgi:hypothetical protein
VRGERLERASEPARQPSEVGRLLLEQLGLQEVAGGVCVSRGVSPVVAHEAEYPADGGKEWDVGAAAYTHNSPTRKPRPRHAFIARPEFGRILSFPTDKYADVSAAILKMLECLMTELVITLLRVSCEEVTDDFLEGLTDEFGWRCTARDASGNTVLQREELPMAELAEVAAGSKHDVNRELLRLGPQIREAHLEFWDKDLFSPNDLLGRLEIRRDGAGELAVTPVQSARSLGDGGYRLTGEGGDYTVWIRFEEVA